MYCTCCGKEEIVLRKDESGNQVCTNCYLKTFKYSTYNKKRFLLPDSPRSMSCCHAKVNPDATYRFTIHDCHNSIRLRGDLKSKEETNEAIQKLIALENALAEFRSFIVEKYTFEEP